MHVDDLILSRGSDMAADLIVMGGYGRSRVRELILGGATRGILDHMTIPVIFSH
jgi:nucleotide-binding universal stress UspA family protein